VFAPISKKFERSVLYNLRTVLALINNTTTKTGLKCVAELDANVYETGIKVTDEEYGAINITYLLSPNGVNTHLAYVVDGTGKSTHFLDKDQVTVFDIKHNIDLSKEEKIKLAQEKAAKKANTAAERQAKSVKPNSQKKKSPKKPVGKTEKVAPLPI
jgi:hypothetical protein